MRQNYLRQVMVLTAQSHQEYLEDFKEEPLNFEEYINYMLGAIYDNENIIEQIIPVGDCSTVFVIYQIQIIKPKKRWSL